MQPNEVNDEIIDIEEIEYPKEQYGVIYLITSPKQKHYVGQTVQTPETRFKQHKYSADKNEDQCPKLCRAIRKYGWENLTKQIIAVAYSKHDLDDLEIQFIIKYNSVQNGYNVSPGGSTDQDGFTSRKSASESNRIYTEYKLPLYCSWYTRTQGTTVTQGFRCVKPNCEQVILCDSSSMDEKYEMILKIHKMSADEIKQFNAGRRLMKNKGNKRDAGEGFPLVEYLSYLPKYETFSVRLPKQSEKKFGTKYGDKKARYDAALEYLQKNIA